MILCREEIVIDDREDGNDIDSDVFRSGFEFFQYIFFVIIDLKQWWVIVSGGFFILSWILLGIDDLEMFM